MISTICFGYTELDGLEWIVCTLEIAVLAQNRAIRACCTPWKCGTQQKSVTVTLAFNFQGLVQNQIRMQTYANLLKLM